MILEEYFNLAIDPSTLISKGEVVKGKHGIVLENDDAFASHYHIVNYLVKNEFKQNLTAISLKEFNSDAKKKEGFKNWPKVEYSSGDLFQQYSLKWVARNFLRDRSKFQEELDFVEEELGYEAYQLLYSILNDKSSFEKSKHNPSRIFLEALISKLIEREFIPKEYYDPTKRINGFIFLISGKVEKNFGYKLNNKWPKSISAAVNLIHQAGNDGSHFNELEDITEKITNDYVRNALVFSVLVLVRYLMTFFKSNPKIKNWEKN